MKRDWYNLNINPAGELYSGLVDFATSECSAVLLVVRAYFSLSPGGKAFIKDLAPHLICQSNSMDWPGTKVNGTALVFRLMLNQYVASALKNATDSLYGWLMPNLPEDLCFLRGDQDPWLISVSHEELCSFILSQDEKERILNRFPELALSLTAADQQKINVI